MRLHQTEKLRCLLGKSKQSTMWSNWRETCSGIHNPSLNGRFQSETWTYCSCNCIDCILCFCSYQLIRNALCWDGGWLQGRMRSSASAMSLFVCKRGCRFFIPDACGDSGNRCLALPLKNATSIPTDGRISWRCICICLGSLLRTVSRNMDADHPLQHHERCNSQGLPSGCSKKHAFSIKVQKRLVIRGQFLRDNQMC